MTEPILRRPPHSREAEQSVLGCLLLNNAVFDPVAGILDISDFYGQDHRSIFGAIKDLILSSKPADVVTVWDRLEASGSEVGGMAYVNALAECVPSASHALQYAETVRKCSVLRRIIASADSAVSAAFDRAADPIAVLDKLATDLAQIERQQSSSVPTSLKDIVLGVVDGINDLAEGKVTPGWGTGIEALDGLLTGGLRPGKVYVLAARPAVGKSSLSQQIGINLARNERPTLMLSQEMPSAEVGQRALSNIGAISYGSIQTGNLTDRDWTELADAMEHAARLPFWVDDQPALRLSDIRAKARSVPNLRVLILDYLQLSAGDGDNRNAEIEAISRGLKQLAKELQIAVLMLSQLNRKVEERQNKEPQLSDLRDSGSIEQDADVVIFLWPLRELNDSTKLVGLKVEKNRGGRLGRFALEFRGWRQQWAESNEPIYQESRRQENRL